MSEFTNSKSRIRLTPGVSIRIAREMLGWSQNKLAEKSGIPQSTISGLEANKITLGVERAKKLAVTLSIHPSVLLFPRWDVKAHAS